MISSHQLEEWRKVSEECIRKWGDRSPFGILHTQLHPVDIETMLKALPACLEEIERLKESVLDMVIQFGYYSKVHGRLHITTGGLSALENAFSGLGWEDPHPYPQGECEYPKCHAHATCGTPTKDGYKHVCGEHFSALQALEDK